MVTGMMASIVLQQRWSNLMIVLVISGCPYALESVPVNLCLSALAARSGWAYGEKNGEQTDLNWGTPWMRTNCL